MDCAELARRAVVRPVEGTILTVASAAAEGAEGAGGSGLVGVIEGARGEAADALARTPDMLPVLGACARRGEFIATGHYRNGILLAPGTALVMADLLEGKPPVIDLSALSPLRFAAAVGA